MIKHFKYFCGNFQSPQPPQYVYWQRNQHMINYDDSRKDITIETIPGPRTQSRLIIREPQIADSGNYTCSASNTEPSSIYVFVSKGGCSLTRAWFMAFGLALSFIHNVKRKIKWKKPLFHQTHKHTANKVRKVHHEIYFSKWNAKLELIKNYLYNTLPFCFIPNSYSH